MFLVDKNGELAAGGLFYHCVGELFSRKGADISSLASALSVERSTIFLLNQIDIIHSGTLVSILNNNIAICLSVDWNMVESAIDSVVDISNAKINKVKNHSDIDTYRLVTQTGFDADRLVRKEISAHLSSFLIDSLFKYNQYPIESVFGCVPANVIKSLCKLKNAHIGLLSHLLYLSKAASFSVNKIKLNTALSSFQASSNANDSVLSLIRAGASYHFVNTYNGQRTVDRAYFKNWRNVLVGTARKEIFNTKLSHDIWFSYQKNINNGMSMSDTFLDMHRRYALRIDTLYNETQRLMQMEKEVDDDDFSDLKNIINP